MRNEEHAKVCSYLGSLRASQNNFNKITHLGFILAVKLASKSLPLYHKYTFIIIFFIKHKIENILKFIAVSFFWIGDLKGIKKE